MNARRASDFEMWREGTPYRLLTGQDGQNAYAAALPTLNLSRVKLEVMVGQIPSIAAAIVGNGEVWVCYYQHGASEKVFPNLTTTFVQIS